MKVKIIIFIIQFQLGINLLNAQNVNLLGYIDGAKDSSEIWFCRSIDGNPINYCGMYDRVVIKNKRFEKVMYVTNTSIINIMPSEYSPKISIICEKGDLIKLGVVQVGSYSYDIKFEGSNSEGQKFFYQSPLFHNYQLIPILSIIIEGLLKNDLSLNASINKLDSFKNKLFSTADTLHVNKKISMAFYKLIKLQSESHFLSSLESSIQNSLDKLSLSGRNIYFSKAQLILIGLQRFYYEKYNPFTPIYNNIDQSLRIINCQNKCRLIEKGVLVSKKIDIGLWVRYNEQSYSFAPIELQHRMMAINLSFNGFYNRVGKQNINDSTDFQLLKMKFPNSPYIPILNRYFKKKIIFFPELQEN